MKMKWIALAAAAPLPAAAMAIGGASGPKIDYEVQGHIGEVMGNPYGIAPLTAVIRDGGYTLADVTVHIVPKQGGQKISYKVSRSQLLTHGGVPVFGLYPDYLNTIRVDYTRIDTTGKKEKFSDEYKLYAPPVYFEPAGNTMERMMPFEAEVKKADPEFSDRLYFVNNFGQKSSIGTRAVWNNPTGGALEWNYWPQNTVIDTKGEVRWFMLANPIYDLNSLYSAGVMMGFKQNADGLLTWGFGQRYVKYDILGREVFNRRLPMRYGDFSHSMDDADNGHYFLRVSSSNWKRADGKNVRTVRDVIAEVDQNGNVVDDFRLFEILDPYRDTLIKALDQGAVCLNIDPAKAGHTLSAADLANMDKSDKFGDIPGTGPGRNWAHVNSIDYDPTDDSIILSARHQGIVKIGRDHQVKWILASPVGWKKGLAERVLTPVDKNGKPLKCEGSQCEGGFDWSWTQHTAWRIDSKSTKDVIYLSVFDNGDARGMEQPPLPTMKYSRAVVYKIDQKKMTVEQIWEVGKDLGYDYFSPVTGITKYMDDKDTMLVFWSTAGMGASPEKAGKLGRLHPRICEYRWGDKSLAVDLTLWDTCGYQAFPVSFEEAFSKN